eukprot:COSAG04_NODE_5610_length_1553_cov_1.488308_2_plen_99_part_00
MSANEPWIHGSDQTLCFTCTVVQTSPVDEPEDDEQRLRGLPDEELKAQFETYRALVNPSTHGGYVPHDHTDVLIVTLRWSLLCAKSCFDRRGMAWQVL